LVKAGRKEVKKILGPALIQSKDDIKNRLVIQKEKIIMRELWILN